jgi:CubicO group peptidase (beta-lactamase class C family)
VCQNDFFDDSNENLTRQNKMKNKIVVFILALAAGWCFALQANYVVAQNSQQPRTSVERRIDGVLKEFYDKYSIPGGVSMAISYKERLVYAGAVGYADKERTIPRTPEHRMRIASVSKSVTSIAIMKLMEEKKLNLNDDVFSETGILKGEYGIPTYNDKPAKITVKQLLEHAGGWEPSPNPNRLRHNDWKTSMQTVLARSPLKNAPGTKYDYSNFSYVVLGRVIEEISGMMYEDYVKEHILVPCGIDGMRIGGDSKSTLGADEVEYIAVENENPYIYNHLRSGDACGSWVANPIELVKLLVRVDGFSTVPDILKKETITIMRKPSIPSSGYALGWIISRQSNVQWWWHNGSLPGSETMMAGTSDGFCWAILINHRPHSSEPHTSLYHNFRYDIYQLFWKIKEIIREWPAGTALTSVPTAAPVIREPTTASPQQPKPTATVPPKPSAPIIPPEEEIRTLQVELSTLEEKYKTLPKIRSNEAEAIRLSNQIHTLKNRLNVLQAGL